jgi:hypothetical protein
VVVVVGPRERESKREDSFLGLSLRRLKIEK